MTKTEIVPFGKYKGQPLEVLAQDHEYMDWLMEQDWFRSRYQNIYAIVINNFQAPSETPEHNILQAKFLDEDYRFKIAYFLCSAGKARDYLDVETDIDPEADGMDIVIDSSHYGFEKIIKIYVEIKPQISDDYPAVMRQIRSSSAYKKFEKRDFGEGEDKIHGMKFCLLVDRYSGSVSEEEFVEFFRAASIRVLFTRDIDKYRIEFSEKDDKWVEVLIDSPVLQLEEKAEEPKKKTDNDDTSTPSQLSLFT